jgi:hypothetical protein
VNGVDHRLNPCKVRKGIKRILAGFILTVIGIYIGLSISKHDKPSMPLLNREDNKLLNSDDYKQVCGTLVR